MNIIQRIHQSDGRHASPTPMRRRHDPPHVFGLTHVYDHAGRARGADRSANLGLLSQQYISDATPTGSALVPGGATFRVWAPRALGVYLTGVFGSRVYDQQTEDRLLSKNPRGTGWGSRREHKMATNIASGSLA